VTLATNVPMVTVRVQARERPLSSRHRRLQPRGPALDKVGVRYNVDSADSGH